MGQMFDALGRGSGNQNPMQMLQSLKADPASFIRAMGFNLPGNIDIRNPQSILGALMQSGQINQGAYRQGMAMMSRFPEKK